MQRESMFGHSERLTDPADMARLLREIVALDHPNTAREVITQVAAALDRLAAPASEDRQAERLRIKVASLTGHFLSRDQCRAILGVLGNPEEPSA